MNKATYTATRRSIRDNGMRYTMQHAKDTNDYDAIFMCDDLQVITRETDWLALRVEFAKLDSKAVAFKLTTN
jgi:hypothetical protein|tara:strand:+ start:596 stop:811 length:216 start_codon:yes stop_codon:yes gene_type:complete